MDSARLTRIIRALLSRDVEVEAPSRRATTGVALFLAGMGTGVLLGVFLAPRMGAGMAQADQQESGTDLAMRPKEPLGEPAVEDKQERSAS